MKPLEGFGVGFIRLFPGKRWDLLLGKGLEHTVQVCDDARD